MSKQDFLLEVGLEEMPARFVTDAMNQLKNKTEQWLKEQRLSFDRIDAYSTPRRLAIIIHSLADQQEDVVEEAKGPAKHIAVDEDGQWTKAALGFAKGQGVEPNDLYVETIKNTEYLFAKKEVKGRETKALLPEFEQVITSLNFPKNMRWGAHSLRYVRPIHWIVALYGNEVIPFSITGVESGNKTRGHRFLGNEATLSDPEVYEQTLLQEYVVVDPERRKEIIREQLQTMEEEKGWKIPIDEGLLEEVNNLVEYPTALYGDYDESYLELPNEVLITSMREHQRYFPVESQEGTLLSHFVTVRNGDEKHLDNVKKGNEKVLRARLSDAMFFYHEDQKRTPVSYVKDLDHIVYHEEIGSLGAKVKRIESLTGFIADSLSVDTTTRDHALRAASLSKFDLVTYMVDEFPELQGLMGERYALLSGESEEVAKAIHEHYSPRHASDRSPNSMAGALVGLADKVDTVVSCFMIGLIPTGSQDPYALRRQASGIVQTVLEHNMPVELETLLKEAVNIAVAAGIEPKNSDELLEQLHEFFGLRLKNMLSERGVRYDVIDAVLGDVYGRLDILTSKAEFLHARLEEKMFKQSVETFSRVTNIAKKAEDLNVQVDTELFEKEEEKALFEQYETVKTKVEQELSQNRVQDAFQALKEIEPTIDAYFDNIMVMSEDEAQKHNRLAQMQKLSELIQSFARFQCLVFTS